MGIRAVSTSQMKRNKTVKRLDGSMVELIKDGKTIIKGGEVVNEEAFKAHVKEIEDRKEAAKAPTMAKVDETLPDRTVSNESKRMDEMEKKLDKILKAIEK